MNSTILLKLLPFIELPLDKKKKKDDESRIETE